MFAHHLRVAVEFFVRKEYAVSLSAEVEDVVDRLFKVGRHLFKGKPVSFLNYAQIYVSKHQ